jgi:hypothetical protein
MGTLGTRGKVTVSFFHSTVLWCEFSAISDRVKPNDSLMVFEFSDPIKKESIAH